MLNVHQFDNYREILKESLLERKGRFGRAFTFAKMAKACRLQRTYLSTVLGGTGHLNTDQVFDAAQFLKLSEEEYRYLSALHECERSTSLARQARLRKEIEALRSAGLRTDSYVEAPKLAQAQVPAALTEFYLDVNAQLVHMFLTVKRFSGDFEKTRRTLNLTPDVFQSALAKIERAGLARIGRNSVDIVQDSFHLPASSELYPAYRLMMRLKAIELLQVRGQDKQFSFSALYSAKAETRPKVQARFLEFIDWTQKLTQSESPSDVYQINFDLVNWTEPV